MYKVLHVKLENHKQINEKDVDEFKEAEENQKIKRKPGLDVNLIHSYIVKEAALHVNRPPRMKELSPFELNTHELKQVNLKRLLNIVFTVTYFVLKLYYTVFAVV